jgi:hypothetical protein
VSFVGTYESLAPTFNEKVKFALSDIECFYSGRKLKLLADSTFALIECTNILTGKWHQGKDLINLRFLSNRYTGVKDFSLICSGSELLNRS